MNAEFFRQIPANLISGIIYTCDFKDPDSFYVSEQFESILGHSNEEVREKGAPFMASLIHPEDRENASEIFNVLSKEKGSHVAEGKYRLKDKSGAWRWFIDKTIATRYGDQGQIEEIVGIVTEVDEVAPASAIDATPAPASEDTPTKEDKSADEDAPTSEQYEMLYILLQETLEATPLAVCWKDTEGIYQGCNTQFLLTAGLPEGTDIRQKTDYDLPWKDTHADEIRKSDLNLIESCHSTSETIKLKEVDGDECLQMKSSRIPLTDNDGETNGILWTLEHIPSDGTMPATLLEYLPAKLALLNKDGLVLQANRLWRDFFGADESELNLHKRIKRRNKVTLQKALADAIEGGDIEVRIDFINSNGDAVTHNCLFAASPLEDPLVQCLAIAKAKRARETSKKEA